MTAPTVPTSHGPEPLDQPLKHALTRLANGISPASVAMAYADWLVHLAVSPSKQAELAGSAWRKALAWNHYATHNWRAECERCVEPLPQDKRFAPHEWRPLAHRQANYRCATHERGQAPSDPAGWQAAAPSFPGSWWPCWHEWLMRQSTGMVGARAVKGIVENGQPVAAPGTYVHQT